MAIGTINTETLKIINHIIAKDSKSSSYKFALLRGVIDTIQNYPDNVIRKEGKVYIPLGLIAFHWLIYFFKIVDLNIPQMSAEYADLSRGRNISFRKYYKPITNYYKSNNGNLSVFINDVKSGNIPIEIVVHTKKLLKEICKTIIDQPLKYIGNSYYKKDYSVFSVVKRPNLSGQKINSLEDLILNCGTISFDENFFDTFDYLGSFLTGNNSLIYGWAEYTNNLSTCKSFNKNQILEIISDVPFEKRKVNAIKDFFNRYKENHHIYCTYTNQKITKYDIDHLLPFSIWKNNSLWNLLPTKPSINNNKRDKIPTEKVLIKSKDRIISYWECFEKEFSDEFMNELKIDLFNVYEFKLENWKSSAFSSLLRKSNYLIENRGFEPWNGLN